MSLDHGDTQLTSDIHERVLALRKREKRFRSSVSRHIQERLPHCEPFQSGSDGGVSFKPMRQFSLEATKRNADNAAHMILGQSELGKKLKLISSLWSQLNGPDGQSMSEYFYRASHKALQWITGSPSAYSGISDPARTREETASYLRGILDEFDENNFETLRQKTEEAIGFCARDLGLEPAPSANSSIGRIRRPNKEAMTEQRLSRTFGKESMESIFSELSVESITPSLQSGMALCSMLKRWDAGISSEVTLSKQILESIGAACATQYQEATEPLLYSKQIPDRQAMANDLAKRFIESAISVLESQRASDSRETQATTSADDPATEGTTGSAYRDTSSLCAKLAQALENGSVLRPNGDIFLSAHKVLLGCERFSRDNSSVADKQ